jgi:hypothetical protein
MRRTGCGYLPTIVLLLVLGVAYWHLMVIAAVFYAIARTFRGWRMGNRL